MPWGRDAHAWRAAGGALGGRRGDTTEATGTTSSDRDSSSARRGPAGGARVAVGVARSCRASSSRARAAAGRLCELRKTTVKTLCIYADYKSDESYTPSKISVRVGNNFHNLQEIRQLELVEPSGWIHVPLTDNHKKPTRTFMIQIAVLANHQNGRDTHMRQIKIYTPVEESSIGKFPRCTTIDFMMYRSIR
ncbi:anaphase-promoting complex subunit 10 isoform X1 [Erinaceus europaeus]|uniref:Anaphase-promoting complex subunit 10 n=1 Tax=Erinaceus europaeus TaxID=9365 RepID=A0ABM3WEK1_ERIEU|nr:anaphase-promoting complex subunit 10 isoform X1 [Erinaceus europaeus]